MSQLVRAAVDVESKRTELREIEWPSIPADGGLLRIIASGCYPLKKMCPHQFVRAGADRALLALAGGGDAIHCSVNRWR
jgi:hypothetical protein